MLDIEFIFTLVELVDKLIEKRINAIVNNNNDDCINEINALAIMSEIVDELVEIAHRFVR